MGGERVSDSSPSEGSGSDGSTPFFSTYTKIFYDHFPYYLSIGMTYELYWEKSADLVISYRKAQELINKKANEQMWWNGLYIYDAISRLSPILHAFAKEGTKAVPYMEKPYPLTKEQAEIDKQERERKEFEAMMARFQAGASAVNTKFRKSEVKTDGDRD